MEPKADDRIIPETDKKKQSAIIMILLAGSLWGCSSIFVNGLRSACAESGVAITGIDAFLVKMLFTVIIYTVFIAIKDPSKFKSEIRDWWIFLIVGGVGVGGLNFCYFTVMGESASVAVILMGLAPVFVMIYSAIFMKEKITKQKLLALVLAMSGAVLVSGILSGADNRELSLGMILIGVLSGIFNAVYMISVSFARKKYDALTVTWYVFVVAFLVTLPFGHPLTTFPAVFTNWKAILYAIGISVPCTMIPYFLYTKGAGYIESSIASILMMSEQVVGSLVGIFVNGEDHGILKIFGIILVLEGLMILSINGKLFARRRRRIY